MSREDEIEDLVESLLAYRGMPKEYRYYIQSFHKRHGNNTFGWYCRRQFFRKSKCRQKCNQGRGAFGRFSSRRV